MTRSPSGPACLSVCLLLAGCVNPLPTTPADRSEPAAEALLDAARQAHGGEAFERIDTIAVAYDGQWLNNIWFFQPVIVDRGYRQSSQERLIRGEAGDWVIGQEHQGPDGVKRVRLDGKGVADVHYATGPGPESDEPQTVAEAAGLVADAYRLFLTAPFYLTDYPGRTVVVMSEPDRVGGYECDQVLVRVEPGFGVAGADHVQVAIDRESRLVRRVRFSLDGFRDTRGATAEVELSDYITRGGVVWPTHFLELVTYPLDREVHDWRMTGLDVDRDLAPADVDTAGWTDAATDPAEPLDPPSP